MLDADYISAATEQFVGHKNSGTLHVMPENATRHQITASK